jgi:cell division protein FtsI (penicillin-binding protein 3)
MTPRIDRVGSLVGVGLTLVLMVLLGRVVELQVAPPARLAAHLGSRQTQREIVSPRGDIVDRRDRLLATTEFGYRVFIDPVEFPQDAGPALTRLADAIGTGAEDLAGRVMPRLTENARRKAERERAKNGPDALYEGPPAPERNSIRYVRVTDVLPDPAVERVKALTVAADRARYMPGVHLELKSVRNYPAAELVASIVGKVGADEDGVLGAERAHDDELEGHDGSIRYIRDVGGRPLWMGPGSFVPAEPGEDLRLSLDLEIQRMGTEELTRGVEEADAAGGRVIVMDCLTGEILAMVDLLRDVPDAVPFPFEGTASGSPRYNPDQSPRPRYVVLKPDPGRLVHPALGRNRCVEDVYEPGSTFKSFVWATVTDLGRASPGENFHTGGKVRMIGRRRVEDVHPRMDQTWREVLVNSSNIGMSMAAERLSFDELRSSVVRLGFGRPTGLGLPGEASGIVTSKSAWKGPTQTSVSFGNEIAVTPVQLARAYCVFARPGEMAGTLPRARLTALPHDDADRGVVYRVFSAPTAQMVRETERAVASAMEAQLARMDKTQTGWKYPMFGKSGTAKIPLGKPPPGMRAPPALRGYFHKQYVSSFIAGAPADNPRLVILVVIDDPGPALVNKNVYYGSHVAGPVVRRLMDRALAYLGVSPTPVTVTQPAVVESGAD